MIRREQLTSFDVESWGSEDLYALQPFRAKSGEAWLTSCAMAWFEQGQAMVSAHREPAVHWLQSWLQHCAEKKLYVVCWNAPFDVAWLIALGLRDEVLAVSWLDGILLQRHLVNEPRFRPNGRMTMGLKDTVARETPAAGGYGDNITFNPQTPEEWTSLLFYNGLDAQHTLTLAWTFLNKLTPAQLRNVLIEARSIPLVAEASVEGIPVNVPAAETLDASLDQTIARTFVTLKINEPTISEKLLASPKQLRELLFGTWNLQPGKLTDGGDFSTDRETLLELAVTDKRAMLVNDYREAKNNRTKFVTGVIGGLGHDAKGQPVKILGSLEYNGDGRVRPQARMFGTYTGRMTYGSKVGRGVAEKPSGVPLHQWKRDPAFRDILECPEGYVLLEFDFAGQEFRWMAVESRDPTMLQLCAPGEDAHAFMGARCTGISYAALRALLASGDPTGKPKRQLGKVANLSLQYRTSAVTLVRVAAVQHKVAITYDQSRNIWLTYRRTYPHVLTYWKRQISMARERGFVETLAGRRVGLGTPDTWVYKSVDEFPGEDAKWAHESTAINFPIQGVGADQKYLAMLLLRDYLPQVEGRFAWELHDGLFAWVPDRYADKAAHELRHLLSNMPYKKAWGVDLPIQFPVDAKMGKSWGQLKELKE